MTSYTRATQLLPNMAGTHVPRSRCPERQCWFKKFQRAQCCESLNTGHDAVLRFSLTFARLVAGFYCIFLGGSGIKGPAKSWPCWLMEVQSGG
jgi:hypothetical protein